MKNMESAKNTDCPNTVDITEFGTAPFFTTIYRVSTVLYLIALTFLSLQPIVKHGGDDLPRQIFNNAMHIPAYGLLTFLLINSMAKYKHSYVASFIFVLVFGVFTEYLQSFVPGRCASIVDLLLNGVGATSFILYSNARRIRCKT